ncbi:hypothetical protein E4U32_002075 [Claviceps aff. humidiphila group G2b]|nr:hypothetical protein E4U32_002075 [Claviceps aff. humidiphila group G2b]
MSDIQVPMSRDPTTPAPRRGCAWSKEDTFELLETLRDREFLGPKDRTASRVYENIPVNFAPIRSAWVEGEASA